MPVGYLIAILLFIFLAMSAVGIPFIPVLVVMAVVFIAYRKLAGNEEEEFGRREGLGSGIPLTFHDGITEGRFKAIGYDARKKCKVESVEAEPSGMVTIKWHSKSGKHNYSAVVDFNDGGHLTGRSRRVSGCYAMEKVDRVVGYMADRIRRESLAAQD